ncbi:tyrosine--tRNA ligase [Acetanaerobacterium sp. MSJ-12]|uniref:Tyrosine--tRNA ligase n=1 Tax=Bittarella massiliensis (ex Durand et al. 2017) TaxID=1720313 RepID=A0AAW5KFA4_9FIRM|nr:tyrosine--tRNA ligase [Bittarella massiliensis (ex Durand et al. 2017)]MBU5419412.1 tyrosine--tRNA ligase [Acetanaerobacterium sp. MSJ-12]MCQ4948935.1 tyrosine--tRNA ligase [Bittarella massiliensis (ex Durand et al. 2017)]
MVGIFNELQARGLIAQSTNMERVEELLNGDKPVTFYIGFDATADSLHVGHFLQLTVMRRLQQAGHRPIALLGGGTTLVGDPTGKTDMRKMLTKEEIAHNVERFQQQMSKFVDFTDGRALVLNNADWLCKLNYLDFLRDVGVYFTVNKMLTAECFKSRMEKGLSFIEFNYMIMQSYDFLHMYDAVGCTMELGGDDQWANILGGVDLIRRVKREEAYGMTFTLLTTKEGKKMGKTESGAVWLDPEKTSPYEFFQYWRNIDDADVINCMKMLTFMPLEEIAQYEALQDREINRAKEKLAFELTKLVHSEEEAQKALEASKALFAAGSASEHMPTTPLDQSLVQDGSVGLLDLMVMAGLTPSKGEARRLVQQGGVSVGEEKIADAQHRVSLDAFKDGFIIIKKGKKTFHKITL